MRGRPAPKKIIENDPIYKSRLITRIVNYVMESGKKNVAEKNVYKALDKIKDMKKVENPLAVLEEAFKNVMPKMEVRSRRVGGANYQVPTPLKHDRAQALAIRWIVNAARKAKGKPLHQSLTQIIIDSSENRGEAVKKKEDTHRMAEANKAFAHFKW